MMFDKKKAAQLILQKHSGHAPQKLAEGGAVENVDHDFAGLHACMEDMVDAISRKHPEDMHKALSSYLELHKQLQPGEEPHDEASENEKAVERDPMF